jgi:hypothetical protein
LPSPGSASRGSASTTRNTLLAAVRALVLGLALWPLGAGGAARAAAPAGEGWEALRSEPATFWFRERAGDRAGDRKAAEALAAVAAAAADRVTLRTGLPVPRHVDVVLARDPTVFGESQPSLPPDWAAGTAWPERGEIYLRTGLPGRFGSDLDAVFLHELTHVALGRAFLPREPPRWLNEGLASFVAGEMSPEDHAILLRAAVSGSLLPLSRITGTWPAAAGHARLAYAQSVDFVAFLASRGTGALEELVRRTAAGEATDAALAAAAGQDLRELEKAWRGRITFWHAWMPLLGGSGTIWGLTSLLFVMAGWKKRRQIRRRMAEMPTAEAMGEGKAEGAPLA